MALNNRKIIPEDECIKLIEDNKDEDIDDLIIVKIMQEDVDLFLSNHLNETDELIIRNSAFKIDIIQILYFKSNIVYKKLLQF